MPGQIVTVYVNDETKRVAKEYPRMCVANNDAYILYDVTTNELSLFLSVLYPEYVGVFHYARYIHELRRTDVARRNYATLDLISAAEWASVLKLSTRWCIASIRELAIIRLQSLLAEKPLERLFLARKYGVNAWVARALRDLVERDNALDDDDVASLELGDIVRIAREREARAMTHTCAAKSTITGLSCEGDVTGCNMEASREARAGRATVLDLAYVAKCERHGSHLCAAPQGLNLEVEQLQQVRTIDDDVSRRRR